MNLSKEMVLEIADALDKFDGGKLRKLHESIDVGTPEDLLVEKIVDAVEAVDYLEREIAMS